MRVATSVSRLLALSRAAWAASRVSFSLARDAATVSSAWAMPSSMLSSWASISATSSRRVSTGEAAAFLARSSAAWRPMSASCWAKRLARELCSAIWASSWRRSARSSADLAVSAESAASASFSISSADSARAAASSRASEPSPWALIASSSRSKRASTSRASAMA